MQGNTSTRAPQALNLVETNEASSQELLCATHDLAPLSIDLVADGTHMGISIKNNNQAEQNVVAAVSTRSVSSHLRLRSQSHLSSSNPKNRPMVAVRRLSVAQYNGLRSS